MIKICNIGSDSFKEINENQDEAMINWKSVLISITPG